MKVCSVLFYLKNEGLRLNPIKRGISLFEQMSEIFSPARLKGFLSITVGKLYNCHFFIWKAKKRLDFHALGDSVRGFNI